MKSIEKTPDTARIVLFLFVAVFVSHFLLINQFGLYEDDYAGSFYINGDAGVVDALRAGYHDKARPVGRALRYTLNYVGASAGGLVGMYVIGFLVIGLNTVLTFLVIRRIAPDFVAIIGALVYCLYPADTTKILLTHSLQIQPAFTFSLLGVLLYQQGRRVAPYLLALLALLTYETAVLPFLAAPLLTTRPRRIPLLRELALHVAVIAGLVIVVLLLRQTLGEARVSSFEGLNFLQIFSRVSTAVVIGPLTSAAMFFYRPVTAITEGGAGAYLLMAVFFAAVLVFLRKHIRPEDVGRNESRTLSGRWRLVPLAININFTRAVGGSFRLMAVGAVLWCGSYLFAFTRDHWPPVDIAGRMTSVHIAATFAAALTLAGFMWLMYLILRDHPGRARVLTGVLSACFALLAGFSYVVQEDYARSWDYQQKYWSRVIELTPDLEADKAIWLGGHTERLLGQTRYIGTHSWADRILLSGIYEYKRQRKPRNLWPRLDLLTDDFTEAVRVKDGKVYFESARTDVTMEEVAVDPGDIIVLHMSEDGGLKRFFGRLRYRSIDLMIRRPAEDTSLPKTRLHEFITGP